MANDGEDRPVRRERSGGCIRDSASIQPKAPSCSKIRTLPSALPMAATSAVGETANQVAQKELPG